MVVTVYFRIYRFLTTHRATTKGGSDKFSKSSAIASHHHEDVHRAHLDGIFSTLWATIAKSFFLLWDIMAMPKHKKTWAPDGMKKKWMEWRQKWKQQVFTSEIWRFLPCSQRTWSQPCSIASCKIIAILIHSRLRLSQPKRHNLLLLFTSLEIFTSLAFMAR